MDTLKAELKTPPVLELPYYTVHLTLNTDACNLQANCVPIQRWREGTTNSIGYWSQSLTNTEQRSDTTHRKCLAILWSVLPLQTYCKQNCFTIHIDDGALKWVLILTDSTGQRARWRVRLSQLELNVVHRAGIKHWAADGLSPLETASKDRNPLEHDLPPYLIHNVNGLCTSVNIIAHDEYCPRAVPNAKVSNDKTKSKSTAYFLNNSRTAAEYPLSYHSCASKTRQLRIKRVQKSLLSIEAQIDGAI